VKAEEASLIKDSAIVRFFDQKKMLSQKKDHFIKGLEQEFVLLSFSIKVTLFGLKKVAPTGEI